MTPWGTPIELERRRRILVCIWAHAYEVHNISLVDDGTFDTVCREIDVGIDTGHPEMDAWFRKHFDPSTGMWIRKHPNKSYLDAKVKWLKEIQEHDQEKSTTGPQGQMALWHREADL